MCVVVHYSALPYFAVCCSVLESLIFEDGISVDVLGVCVCVLRICVFCVCVLRICVFCVCNFEDGVACDVLGVRCVCVVCMCVHFV